MTARIWLALSTVVIAGCAAGGDRRAPSPPSDAAVAHVIATTREPTYWFGRRYLADELGKIDWRYGRAFSYGEPYYDTDTGTGGWLYPTGVLTRARDVRNLGLEEAPTCWHRIRRTVIWGCIRGEPQELTVLTGSLAVYVDLETGSGPRAVRALKPLNSKAPFPLPAPDRFTCHELSFVPKSKRALLPRALRPRERC